MGSTSAFGAPGSGQDPNPGRQNGELITRIGEKDVLALRQLYEAHSPWLRLRLSKRCADPDLVDQAIQDTFVAVWEKAGGYQGSGEVGAWLWGIAIRRLIDLLRRRRLLDLPRPASVRSAEEEVLLGVTYGDVGQAMERLAPELMAVVQATILDGLTMREAARLLGIPVGTVKSRLMRAKSLLREQLT